MPTLVQVNFPMDGPWGQAMSEAFAGLAHSINDEPGFLWKVWIEDADAGQAGGIYVFDSPENARAYVDMHTQRLAGFGISDVDARFFDVNEPLSEITHAPFAPR